MSKVNNQYKLYDYEAEASDHAKHHPGWSKLSLRNKESTNYTANYNQILDAPEAKIQNIPLYLSPLNKGKELLSVM